MSQVDAEGAAMADLWGVLGAMGKLMPKKTAGKIYDDALSGPFKQIGKLGTDTMKSLRLILVPLQFGAAYQDRLERSLKNISKRVPKDRQVEAPPEVVGPIIEKMRWVAEGSELWDMFEEVLAKSIDKDEQSKVHPAFGQLIPTLSRDEAWIVYRLRDRDFEVVDHLELNRAENKFENRVVETSELPLEELYQPDLVELSFAHLNSLGLVTWPVYKEEATFKEKGGQQTGSRRKSKMTLTELGRLFAAACIPAEGFEKHAKPSSK